MRKNQQTIQDQFEKHMDFFKSMEIIDNTVILKVRYPLTWVVYNTNDGSIKVVASEDAKGEWFYYGDKDSVRINDFLALIDDTVKTNKSAEAKLNLLNDKINELKDLFAHEDINKLQTLEFIFSTRHKRKYKAKSIENNTQQEINKDVE